VLGDREIFGHALFSAPAVPHVKWEAQPPFATSGRAAIRIAVAKAARPIARKRTLIPRQRKGRNRRQASPPKGGFFRTEPVDTDCMGLSEGLRHSLESYLKKSAADLDERGAEITFRENEVEFEIKRLETLENELNERAARVEELQPQQERADEALRRALGTLEERALALAEKAGELRERTTKIVEAEAELTERERLAAYRRERLRSEQKLLAEREREIVESEGDLLSAETATQATRWIEHREKRLNDNETLIQERIEDVGRREKELESREVRINVDLQVRQDELDRRERELAELEEKLARKERELRVYVAQIQGGLPVPTLVRPEV
jgi:DNA repair exonuclease SbcCD ATPase subunit